MGLKEEVKELVLRENNRVNRKAKDKVKEMVNRKDKAKVKARVKDKENRKAKAKVKVKEKVNKGKVNKAEKVKKKVKDKVSQIHDIKNNQIYLDNYLSMWVAFFI